MIAAGVRERGRILVRESVGERGAQLGTGARAFREQRTSEVEHRCEIPVVNERAEVAMPPQLGVEHRLHERAQREAVGCADEVDGCAHEGDAHDLPRFE